MSKVHRTDVIADIERTVGLRLGSRVEPVAGWAR